MITQVEKLKNSKNSINILGLSEGVGSEVWRLTGLAVSPTLIYTLILDTTYKPSHTYIKYIPLGTYLCSPLFT